jgi:hypothetical protein
MVMLRDSELVRTKNRAPVGVSKEDAVLRLIFASKMAGFELSRTAFSRAAMWRDCGRPHDRCQVEL